MARMYLTDLCLNNFICYKDGMLITLLPEGPTMNFKLSNVKLSDEIKVTLINLPF